MPSRKEAVDGLFAIQYLIEACADGSFYQDYDESTRLLGKARRGMSVVAHYLDDDDG